MSGFVNIGSVDVAVAETVEPLHNGQLGGRGNWPL